MSSHRKMGHIQEPRVYLFTLLALLGLTVVTVGASELDFGFGNTLVAVLIAVIKASFVVLYFMHGKYEGKLTWAFIWYPLVLLVLLLGGLYLDYGARQKGYALKTPTSITLEHESDSGESQEQEPGH